MPFRAEKLIAALPATLTPDTLYCVRVGSGFDAYVSDSTGTTAHKLNNRSEVRGSGRAYAYTDLRWVTNSDDNYGPAYYQFNESAGTGINPVVEWEHMGDLLMPGTRIKSLTIAGKTNSVELTDMEVYGLTRRPNPDGRWQTGFDNDGEDTVTDLFRGLFSTGGEEILSGNSNDFRAQRWVFDHTVTDMSMLSLYLKPVGALTATRYFRCTYLWEIET